MQTLGLRIVLAFSLMALGCGSANNDTGGGDGDGGDDGAGGQPSGKGGSGGKPGTGQGGSNAGGAPSGDGGSIGSGGAMSGGGMMGSGGATGDGGATADGGSNGTGGGPGSGGSSTDGPPSGAGGNIGGSGGGGTTQCGTTPMAFDVKAMGAKESLVVDPDGNIYFSSRTGSVGRYLAPYDKPPQTQWATIPGQVFGVILDPKRKVVYAGTRGANKMYRIPMADASKMDVLAPVKGGVNGLTLGDDGTVYYTDQGGGHVYGISPDGMEKQVTKSPVSQANGLAFAPDGSLHVLSWTKPGVDTRIVVDANHMEVSRTMFASVPTGNADGIAFDKMGNAYITSGGLYKVSADGKQQMKIDNTSGANVEFGAGALSCTDLLWAGSDHLIMNGVAGADVPWHRK
jgi:sugar lactone lactonase YvrE